MSRSVEDFLTAWMSSTLPGQWLWIPARQCSVAPRKSDATVSTTEHSRFYSCWWMCIIFSSTPLDYCICDILQDLVYKGRRLSFANIQDLKEAIKNKMDIETVRKSIAQWKNDWMRLESRMEARLSTFSANRCDWISISCSQKCWTYWLYFVRFGHPIRFCVFHCQNKSVQRHNFSYCLAMIAL